MLCHIPGDAPEWRILLVRFFLDLNQKSRKNVVCLTDLKSVPFQDRQRDSECSICLLLQEHYQERAMENNGHKYLC